MWTLLLLLISSAASQKDYSTLPCGARMFRQCEETHAPLDIPSTEEELEKFCKSGVEFFQCAETIAEQCEDKDKDDRVAYTREMRSNIIRVCDKENVLYSAVVDNLPCLKKKMDQGYRCPGANKDWITTFTEALSSYGLTDVIPADPIRCLSYLYGIACFAYDAEKVCGEVARDVVIDIAQGFDYPFTKCPAGVKDHLPTIVRAVELLAEKEKVENFIKRKK